MSFVFHFVNKFHLAVLFKESNETMCRICPVQGLVLSLQKVFMIFLWDCQHCWMSTVLTNSDNVQET